MQTSDVSSPGKAQVSVKSLLPSGEKRARLRRWRGIKDGISKYGIGLAGISVVIALATIFIYLFSEVGPIFSSAKVEHSQSFQVPLMQNEQVLHSTLERYNGIGLMATNQGRLHFFNTLDGSDNKTEYLSLPDETEITAFAAGHARSGLLLFGLNNGKGTVAKHEYDLSYPDDVRLVTPKITYPLGQDLLVLDEQGMPLKAMAIQEGRNGTGIAVYTADGRLGLNVFSTRTNFMTGGVTVQRTSYQLPSAPASVSQILLDSALRNMYVADNEGYIHYYDIVNPSQAFFVESVRVVEPGQRITAMEFLNGAVSIIVGSSSGAVSQWFLVRDDNNVSSLTRIRDFQKHPAAIRSIAAEYTRKGFMVLDDAGYIGIHHGTASRTLLLQSLGNGITADKVAISPINTAFYVQDTTGKTHFFNKDNAHPDVSFRSLWNQVWYEGRQKPEYVWQASSGSNEFEPKMSLVPLTIGTLKAAFFAMLFAMPLAIMGAIYTAYFMSPKLRGKVKPTIEIMEALPTVILGFLAGLWLAPFIEDNLPAVFSILILMPVAMLLMAYAWRFFPAAIRHRVPGGWEAVILIPVILLVGWLCVSVSPAIELAFFDGSMRQWFTETGITYDQRNALVVGIAMGFAVIPTIFSIAEDAVFNVPKHLTQGSLALGATPWQTVMGVVIPTASPGIFSAVMVGFGRAVGETMIVLMATGNSPVVNFNIFEGMRTLSANIAVELPETAVGSTHFRVLFLAALVLFVITFFANTLAEVIRQRLRKRYSNL
ncbi:ABC transporter permease subunit [Alkalimonas sp. MEB108]|uniref:ABC transporter permease subunit n=1 Tax=Alkalimonas cellulosilytica TaxID=3058395 RepID=A0ABU7J3V6_9GAMM|nr:ABC transporter permease subunit [Alkalimonas sp. MEB108]MEE2001180.1 ABC transporter permease subunit [Alkalimonas sp. MEB108]